MWRFVKEVPKAVRQSWNSSSLRTTPQTVCRDDDSDCSKVAVPVGQHICSVRHLRRFEEWWKTDQSWHWSSGRQEGDRHTQSHKKWSATGPSYNAVEALGWGTVLVLGLQLTKLYHLKSLTDHQRECNPHHTCLITCLNRLISNAAIRPSTVCCVRETRQATIDSAGHFGAFNLTADQYSGTVLEEKSANEEREEEEFWDCDTDLLGQESKWFFVVPPGEDLLYDKPSEQCERKEKFQSVTFQDEPVSPKDDLSTSCKLEQAAMEWKLLTETVTAQTYNHLALKQLEHNDTRVALKFWKQASDAGYGKAQYNLGLCYELGKGTKKDLRKAAEQYSLGAVSGHKMAMYNLAMLYLQGEGGLNIDVSMAMSLLETAASSGLVDAQRELGVLYTESDHKDMVRAAQLFNMAATQKDAKSQYYMGICLENGWGVVKDMEKAVQMYSSAAADGHTGALHNLAVFYEQGLGGLHKDRKAALKLYEEASRVGNSASQKGLHRLRAQLEEEARHKDMERVRLQFDGGTRGSQSPTRSRSSPLLTHANSLASLSVYIRENMADFGVTDLDLTNSSSILDLIHSRRVTSLRHSQSAGWKGFNDPGGISLLDERPSDTSSRASFFISDCDDFELEEYTVTENEVQTEPCELSVLQLSGSFGTITV